MSDQSHDVYKSADWLQKWCGTKDDIIKAISRATMSGNANRFLQLYYTSFYNESCSDTLRNATSAFMSLHWVSGQWQERTQESCTIKTVLKMKACSVNEAESVWYWAEQSSSLCPLSSLVFIIGFEVLADGLFALIRSLLRWNGLSGVFPRGATVKRLAKEPPECPSWAL